MVLLYATLHDLWRLLDARGKWLAGLLVLLLVISGTLEMGSVFFLFGYIAALSETDTGDNPVSLFYRAIGQGFEGAAFTAVTGLALIGVFAIKNVVGLLTSFYLMRFAMKRYERIGTQLFEGYLQTRFEVFTRRGLMVPQQVLGSVSSVFDSSFNPALGALSDIAIIVTMMGALMLVLDPFLVIGAGLILGLGGGAFLALTRRLSRELGARRMKAEQGLAHTMLDGFRGLIDTRLGNLQRTLVERYARGAGEFALVDRRAQALDMTPRALNEMVLACGIVVAAVYFASTPGGIQGALPVLAVMGFAGLRVTSAMSRLASALQQMRAGEPARERMMGAIRETAPELLGGGSSRGGDNYLADDQPLPQGCSGRLERRIAVEGASFTYPDAEAPAVDGVSLDIPRGSFIGFCGPSGGGKSTLALIVMGLLRPQQGRVLCDDWDVFRHIRAWHANIGHVGQALFISPRSVRENVAFGYEPGDIDDVRVWRALEMASLADVIRSRPGGLDTNLGEEGTLVSGGQRQRLIIARALYRDPDVLVFDEATAALDTQTETEVTEAINRLSGAKTVICIAHRLSTIRDADRIYVIEAGRIAASGTYDELAETSAAFQRIVRGTP
ncbi:MAG TPA: ABC transporter ATP-binding protein [Thermohalobaculum sp.]|nr:ABC transporter ATP-binding protein [Thermohalobaculum sp.]